MNFLIILLAVAAEFTISSFVALRHPRWSTDWAAWITRMCSGFGWWRGWLAATLILGVPVIVAATLFALLDAALPLLGQGAALFVLLLMFGPEDLGHEVEMHKNALAVDAAVSVTPAFVEAARGTDLGAPSGDAEFDATRVELAALALAADRAWFQPLFWFFVLGPVGAVMYRLGANLRHFSIVDASIAAALTEAREAMEWLPARITAFALGFAGTLVPVLDSAREVGLTRWAVSGELVARVALAAADNGRIREVISGDARIYRINMMFALLKRALIVWLVLIAGAALLIA